MHLIGHEIKHHKGRFLAIIAIIVLAHVLLLLWLK